MTSRPRTTRPGWSAGTVCTTADELELADQFGFDGICLNEHHQSAYGLMPSPNIMAACLARRTSRSKLVILGNVLTIYDHPLRVAEEIAVLDVLSGGRVVSGQVVGTGNEFFFSQRQPTCARERFREAHRADRQGMVRASPFAWEGEHYQFRYVNVWPRPIQQPHPPIWIPGSGSQQTIDSVGPRSAGPISSCRRWRPTPSEPALPSSSTRLASERVTPRGTEIGSIAFNVCRHGICFLELRGFTSCSRRAVA
jgi:alkanesulfonate monooxygenase SsuD/methylene tetrahydromethanopterin reductase-like flavin-dependent oxidoreductase (luciferase family)